MELKKATVQSPLRKKPGCSRKKVASFACWKGEFKDLTDKSKVTVYLTPETKDLIQSCYKEDNCSSVSMFMEKAALFYCGFLRAKQAEHYLPRVLRSFLQGSLDVFADRMGKLLFKQAVESNLLHHIFAADCNMDLDTYERLRNRSVREVRETNGKISFKDDLIFQKSL